VKIKLPKINRSKFKVQERVHSKLGNVVLITPNKDKHSWEDGELHLRSLLCRPDGEVLCSGLPKFFNYGERVDLDRLAEKCISSDDIVYFPEKMDGSLIIRTVIDGYVSFRTRGSHHLGEFEEKVMSLVEEKYPNLLDESYKDYCTMLFEYTSPNNQIVIVYDDCALTFLGEMHYNGSTPEFVSSPALIEEVSALTGVNAVKFRDMNNLSPEGILKEVSGWMNLEGVVLWCVLPDGRIHLAKIKAEEYRRIHWIKYQLSCEKIWKFCWVKGIETKKQFRNELYILGLDWEAMDFALPAFEDYNENRIYYENEVAEMIKLLDEEGVPNLDTRKEKALALKKLTMGKKELFNIGIQYCLGNLDRVADAKEALILDISVGRLGSYGREAEELIDSMKPTRE
jgi:hypothetical protein